MSDQRRKQAGNVSTSTSPPAHRRQRRRRHTRPEQHPQNLRQTTLRKELTMAKPNRNNRKTGAILNRTRYAVRERRPRHNPATSAATRMAAMLRHFQRDAAPGGRKPNAQPHDRTAPLPKAIPRSPGTPTEHGPPRGSGSPSGTASCPCGPPDRPACDPSCPSGSACDARTLASSDRRSTAAGRCCGCSDQDDAPNPKSVPGE